MTSISSGAVSVGSPDPTVGVVDIRASVVRRAGPARNPRRATTSNGRRAVPDAVRDRAAPCRTEGTNDTAARVYVSSHFGQDRRTWAKGQTWSVLSVAPPAGA